MFEINPFWETQARNQIWEGSDGSKLLELDTDYYEGQLFKDVKSPIPLTGREMIDFSGLRGKDTIISNCEGYCEIEGMTGYWNIGKGIEKDRILATERYISVDYDVSSWDDRGEGSFEGIDSNGDSLADHLRISDEHWRPIFEFMDKNFDGVVNSETDVAAFYKYFTAQDDSGKEYNGIHISLDRGADGTIDAEYNLLDTDDDNENFEVLCGEDGLCQPLEEKINLRGTILDKIPSELGIE
ncbi:hypothetical protein GF362_01245 [Candidatus Dojkabacteria bacterium]|nr:hypothetical protein [Candidatus Dojkabacteria bacterium]